MTTTGILAVIGAITVILTAAARIPQALAEFLRACILVAAAREFRTVITKPPPRAAATPANPGADVQRTPDISADDSGY